VIENREIRRKKPVVEAAGQSGAREMGAPMGVPLLAILLRSSTSWKWVSEKERRKYVSKRRSRRKSVPSRGKKKGKTTAPRIPAWSPTVVLTRRHSG
jgi:hypothetical protein